MDLKKKKIASNILFSCFSLTAEDGLIPTQLLI